MFLKGRSECAFLWHLFSPDSTASMSTHFGLWDKGALGERQGEQTDLCHRNSIVTETGMGLYPGQ